MKKYQKKYQISYEKSINNKIDNYKINYNSQKTQTKIGITVGTSFQSKFEVCIICEQKVIATSTTTNIRINCDKCGPYDKILDMKWIVECSPGLFSKSDEADLSNPKCDRLAMIITVGDNKWMYFPTKKLTPIYYMKNQNLFMEVEEYYLLRHTIPVCMQEQIDVLIIDAGVWDACEIRVIASPVEGWLS